MGAAFKVGTSVQQVMPAPKVGKVVDIRYMAKEDAFQYCVELDVDGDGVPDHHWFNEKDIAAVKTEGGEGEPK